VIETATTIFASPKELQNAKKLKKKLPT